MYKISILVLTFLTISSVKTQTKIEFREYDLDNGLHVILHQDNTNPIVSVDIWYHVGAKDEDPGKTGFAHLFEHMMFQGSKDVGKTEHFTYIQKAGGTLNGTTNQDRTNYFETLPSNQLELALWLESDRMSYLNVTQENFDNQREVVKEEKRQRYDNAPYGSRWENLYKRAFKGQTYEWLPIGSMEDLNAANLSYAQEFYSKYYSPDNAVLVISGDINFDSSKVLVAKYFGGLKPAGTIKKNYIPIVYNEGEQSDTVYENVQLPAIFIGYKIPGISSDDIHSLDLLSSVLSDGRSSRLYKRIIYDEKLSKSIGSFVWDNEIGGLFIVSSTGLPNTNLRALENEIDEEIDKIKSGTISETELEKVKNSYESGFTNSLQTTMGKAEQLAYYWTYFKNTGMINTHLGLYTGITADQIKESAKKYLKPENRVVLYYYPKVNGKSNN
jgi:zinc protease